ncbi:hypothetical protein U0070_001659 [Myodes glareolus]|uniref:Ig-like domain-containing protein n=1 Tax=Myodes glareolus TaxID=447135 RepID=A0AAW0H4N5_MYOGA
MVMMFPCTAPQSSPLDLWEETTVTQSPAFLSMATGEKVTITCRTSTDIDDDMNWYQQKPGQAPRLLISEGNTLNSGVPSRFMSSGYGTDFTLKIDGIQSDDAANYFCQQSSHKIIITTNQLEVA